MGLRIFCVCLNLLSLVGCGEKKDEGPQQKPLIVITSPDNPPFEFKDTGQGGDKIIGFDMDVAQKVGQYLGRPVQIVEAEFSTLIPSLQSGRADMAMATLIPTDERRRSVDFSDPYYTYKFALLVPENAPFTSKQDLKDKKVGVQMGSSHEILAHQWEKSIPGLSLVSLNKVGDLVQELKSGRLQAVLTEDITARKIAASTPGLHVVVLDIQGESPAIAFPKGSPLVGPVNEALKAIKSDIDHMAEKWMTQ